MNPSRSISCHRATFVATEPDFVETHASTLEGCCETVTAAPRTHGDRSVLTLREAGRKRNGERRSILADGGRFRIRFAMWKAIALIGRGVGTLDT